ncbi:MAG TPA: Hint domain-containing protein, partial [Acetobacteraceae bacterium]|nr:Hint domain-containing protein [Acetobacteraceae bacterium]
SANVAVSIAAPATLSWQGGSGSFGNGAAWSGGNAPANGDVAVFGSHVGAADIITGTGEASALTIAGAYDFAGSFVATGLGGAALSIDHQAVALFDANAAVNLGGSMLIGDAGGAGTLGIAGSLAAQSVDVSGNANATGSLLDVSGSLASAGAVQVGASAAGTLDLSGNLSAGQMTLGASGVLRGVGVATAGLGALDLEGGTLALSGGASASAGNGMVNGGTILLAGQSSLAIGQTLTMAAGTLSVGAEAALSAGAGGSIAGSVLDDSGMITIGGLILGGTANLTSQSSLVSGGAVTLTAGASLSMTDAMLTASSLAIASGATLSGFGEIGGTGSGTLPAIAADGALTASGGTLTLGGNLTGNVTIGAGAAIDLVHGASGGTISFTGAGETLIINDVAAMQDVVSGMVAGDAIELIGIVPGEVGIANGMVNIADPSSFGFSPAASQPAPQVASNGSGGSTITMGGEMPCFARGTRLLTPSGYRPVELLNPGDPLVTQGGVARGIAWIGSRVIDLATDPAAHLLRPVVIAAGAFGPGLPLRPLRFSLLHAVFIDGALIPAVLLVNGATITRDDRIQAVTSYHVELARHEVVRAEGLAVESYRDTGNRHRFAEGRGMPCGMLPACAPMLTRGDGLARVRQALHERALAFGYRMIHRPELHLWTRGQRVEPRLRGGRACFALPDGPSFVELRARSAAPAETDPASEDRRELGVCVGVIRADGRSIAWRGEGDGWHPRAMGDRGCWTGGRAVLELPRRARRLSLDLIGAVRLWQAPSI